MAFEKPRLLIEDTPESQDEVAEFINTAAQEVLSQPQPSLEDFAFKIARITALQGTETSYSGIELASLILEARKSFQEGVQRGESQAVEEAFREITRSAGLRAVCVEIMKRESASEKTIEDGWLNSILTAQSLSELTEKFPATSITLDGGKTFIDWALVKRRVDWLQDQLAYQSNDGVLSRLESENAITQCLQSLPQEGEFAVALGHAVKRLADRVVQTRS